METKKSTKQNKDMINNLNIPLLTHHTQQKRSDRLCSAWYHLEVPTLSPTLARSSSEMNWLKSYWQTGSDLPPWSSGSIPDDKTATLPWRSLNNYSRGRFLTPAALLSVYDYSPRMQTKKLDWIRWGTLWKTRPPAVSVVDNSLVSTIYLFNKIDNGPYRPLTRQ